MEVRFTIMPEEVREIVKEYILAKYPMRTQGKAVTVKDGYHYDNFVVIIEDKEEEGRE